MTLYYKAQISAILTSIDFNRPTCRYLFFMSLIKIVIRRSDPIRSSSLINSKTDFIIFFHHLTKYEWNGERKREKKKGSWKLSPETSKHLLSFLLSTLSLSLFRLILKLYSYIYYFAFQFSSSTNDRKNFYIYYRWNLTLQKQLQQEREREEKKTDFHFLDLN